MERKKIREFYCRTCNKSFFILVEKEEEIKCPYCNGKDLVKVPKVLLFVNATNKGGKNGRYQSCWTWL